MTDRNCTSLAYTVPNPIGTGGRTFSVVRTLTREIKDWANQLHTKDGESLTKAMKDLDDLLVTCWGEIDESLTRLSLAEHHLKKGRIDEAKEHIHTAKRYLNRWQDREGVNGNALIPQVPVPLDNDIKGLNFSRESFGGYSGRFRVTINPNEIDRETLLNVWPHILDSMCEVDSRFQSNS